MPQCVVDRVYAFSLGWVSQWARVGQHKLWKRLNIGSLRCEGRLESAGDNAYAFPSVMPQECPQTSSGRHFLNKKCVASKSPVVRMPHLTVPFKMLAHKWSWAQQLQEDLRAFLDQAWSTSPSWGNTVVVCWRTFCLLCCGPFWELKSHTAHAFAAFGWSGPGPGWHCLLGSLPERIGSSRTLTALCMWFEMHLLRLYCVCVGFNNLVTPPAIISVIHAVW